MTTHETVNRRYAELQTILRDAFQAEGRGLVEMTISLQDRFPKSLVWELRSIGHIRNQVVHENLARVPKYFEPLCKEALATLKQLKKQFKQSTSKRKPTQQPATPQPAAPPAAAAPATIIAPKPKPKVSKPAKKPAKKKAVKSRGRKA
jgi:hypothetical protein